MPHFHLNVICETVADDGEGIERASLNDAKMTAVIGVRKLIAEDIRQGLPIFSHYRIEITDRTGAVLDTVRFSDVIKIGE